MGLFLASVDSYRCDMYVRARVLGLLNSGDVYLARRLNGYNLRERIVDECTRLSGYAVRPDFDRCSSIGYSVWMFRWEMRENPTRRRPTSARLFVSVQGQDGILRRFIFIHCTECKRHLLVSVRVVAFVMSTEASAFALPKI